MWISSYGLCSSCRRTRADRYPVSREGVVAVNTTLTTSGMVHTHNLSRHRHRCGCAGRWSLPDVPSCLKIGLALDAGQASLLLAALVSLALCVTTTAKISDRRVQDHLFRNATLLLGQKVTCGRRPAGNRVFPSDAWSCYSIQVGGRPLRYTYLPGIGVNSKYCAAKSHKSNDTAVRHHVINDIAALCRHLLFNHGIQRQLLAAMVTDASCKVTQSERFVFSKRRDGHFAWTEYPAGSGSVNTLQCMVVT